MKTSLLTTRFMRIFFKSVVVSLSSIVLAALLCVASASATHVQNVRVGEHPDKTRIVIETSGAMQANVFTLSSPERLIVDFKGKNLSCAALPHFAGKLIKSVRHSSDEQTLRLVFDLAARVSVKSQFSLPADGGKPHRLVLDVIHSGPIKEMQSVQKAAPVLTTPATRNASLVEKKPAKHTAPKAAPYRKYTVVLDPGHGGKDPGAPGANGVHEKMIVLSTAKRLRDLLQETGRYNVILTRSDDRFIRLSERVRIARDNNADLFVSIHADSVESRQVRGASVYTLSEKASDAQTARLAARENKVDLIAGVDLSDEGADVATILIDLAMRDTKNQSVFLASQFVDAFKSQNIRTLRTPLHSAGFAVLKAPDIPSVLVEIGFMSNRAEADLLNTPAHQKKIAGALRDSINAYFDKQTHYAEQ